MYINGIRATPDEIAFHCVNDGFTHMADYVMDDMGRLMEIRYDKVVCF